MRVIRHSASINRNRSVELKIWTQFCDGMDESIKDDARVERGNWNDQNIRNIYEFA